MLHVLFNFASRAVRAFSSEFSWRLFSLPIRECRRGGKISIVYFIILTGIHTQRTYCLLIKPIKSLVLARGSTCIVFVLTVNFAIISIFAFPHKNRKKISVRKNINKVKIDWFRDGMSLVVTSCPENFY